MNKDNLLNFVNYNYMPFSKSQCVKRIILLWIFNIPFYIINKFMFFVGVVFTIINLIVSFVFIYLIRKKSDTKEARFLCDGITTVYYSVLLNIVAFMLLSFNKDYSFLLMLILIAVLLLSIFISWVIVYKCIKNNEYALNTANGKFAIAPFGGAVLGMFFARKLLVDTNDTQIGIIVLGLCVLFFSCIASIGSVSFVKLFVLRKIKENQ